MRGERIPGRIRLEGVSTVAVGLWHPAACRTAGIGASGGGLFLLPPPRPPAVTTKISPLNGWSGWSGGTPPNGSGNHFGHLPKGSRIRSFQGFIIADSKFEFGTYQGGIILIDEVLTPDSSRFWLASDYQPGKPQQPFDKQFVRDYLEEIRWDKTPPRPSCPTGWWRQPAGNTWMLLSASPAENWIAECLGFASRNATGTFQRNTIPVSEPI